jgi:hypothetical protein
MQPVWRTTGPGTWQMTLLVPVVERTPKATLALSRAPFCICTFGDTDSHEARQRWPGGTRRGCQRLTFVRGPDLVSQQLVLRDISAWLLWRLLRLLLLLQTVHVGLLNGAHSKLHS